MNSPASLFAQMCVRIAEPDEKIRLHVFECLNILLKITAIYKGAFTESYINKPEFNDGIVRDNSPESCKQVLEVFPDIVLRRSICI